MSSVITINDPGARSSENSACIVINSPALNSVSVSSVVIPTRVGAVVSANVTSNVAASDTETFPRASEVNPAPIVIVSAAGAAPPNPGSL